MALDRISLTDFRNHAATELGATARFNLLVGDNGAGKTNVLEALSLLAPGRGLRRAALSDIARAGSERGFGVGASLAPAAVGAFAADLAQLLADDFPDDPQAVPHRCFAAINRAP